MAKDDLVAIELPECIMKRIRDIIDESDGLFEDEADFISHCIIYHNRNAGN